MQASTSTIPLRPRTVLEIIDASFRIYRENFLPLITLTALVVVPITIFQFVFSAGNSASLLPTTSSRTLTSAASSSAVGVLCLAGLVSIALSLAQTTILNGVITVITSERQMGRRLSLGQAWAESRQHLGTLAWGFVIFYAVMFALILVIGLGSALCPLVFVLFAIVAYLAITVGALLPSVAMLEGRRGNEALQRTVALARPRFWQIIGFSLLVGIITFIFSLVVGALVGVLVGASAVRAASPSQQVWTTALTTILDIFLLPITPIGMTLMYYDSRIRTEGLDLALQSMGPNARPWQVPPAPSTGLFVQQDWVNMLILGVIVIAASLLFAGAVSTFLNTITPGLGSLIR